MKSTHKVLVLAALIVIFAAPTVVADGIRGCTVDFLDDEMRVFEGYGAAMVSAPALLPMEIGNVRINAIKLPCDSELGMFGLMMPHRGSYAQSVTNLDTSGGARQGLTLLCEAIDPDQPIGLRIRADCQDWSAHYAHLLMEIGPNAWDRMLLPTQPRRFGNGPHRWYMVLDLATIYGKREVESEFALVLSTQGRGPFSISGLEIARYAPLSRGFE